MDQPSVDSSVRNSSIRVRWWRHVACALRTRRIVPLAVELRMLRDSEKRAW